MIVNCQLIMTIMTTGGGCLGRCLRMQMLHPDDDDDNDDNDDGDDVDDGYYDDDENDISRWGLPWPMSPYADASSRSMQLPLLTSF